MSGHKDLPKTLQGNIKASTLKKYSTASLQICPDFEYSIIEIQNNLQLLNTNKFKLIFHFRNVWRTDAERISQFIQAKILPLFDLEKNNKEIIKTIYTPIHFSGKFGGALEIKNCWDLTVWPFTKLEAIYIQSIILDHIYTEFGVTSNDSKKR